MSLTVYHLKTCDTCRKAIKVLGAAGHELSLIDVRTDGIDDDTLKALMAEHGWEVVLNRRSTTWRGLSDKDKESPDNDKAIALIAAHPTLLKRPVIMSEGQSTIGWRVDAQKVWL